MMIFYYYIIAPIIIHTINTPQQTAIKLFFFFNHHLKLFSSSSSFFGKLGLRGIVETSMAAIQPSSMAWFWSWSLQNDFYHFEEENQEKATAVV